MSLPNNPTTEYLLQHVPLSILESFLAANGDLDLLAEKIKSIPFFKKYHFQHLWELQILTDTCGDYKDWSVTIWSRRSEGQYLLSPLLFFVLLGRLDVVSWFAENKRSLFVEDAFKVAEMAARTPHPQILQWLYAKDKQFIYSAHQNIAHLAAAAANTEFLNFINEKEPDLLKIPGYSNSGSKYMNLAHFAAESGDRKTLAWVYNSFPSFFDKKENYENPAHYAAKSGSVEALDWFLANKPELLEGEDDFGKNLAHFAAQSGNPSSLAWVIHHKPNLHKKITSGRDHSSIIDFALLSQSKPMIAYLINEFPEMSKKLLDKHISYMTTWNADAFTNTNLHLEARDETLVELTKQVFKHQAMEKEIKTLKAFKEDWQRVIVISNSYNLEELVATKNHFPKEFQEYITKTMPVFALKKIPCADEDLTRVKFQELIEVTNQLFPVSQDCFFKKTQPLFLQKLNVFNSRLKNENLNDMQTLCLKLLINDYKNGLLGAQCNILDLLILKLQETNIFPKEIEYYKLSRHEQIGQQLNKFHETFSDNVKRYVELEYLPYAIVMQNLSEEEAKQIKPAAKFILARHKESLLADLRYSVSTCGCELEFALSGKKLPSELRKYLRDELQFRDETLACMVI